MAEEQIKAVNVGIILLAAGGSSRLGRPKQLLLYKGETFLKHSLQAAIESAAHKIVVVVGSSAEIVKKELTAFDVHVSENVEWEEGMASSIRCGIKALLHIDARAEAIIVMVCDQPFVTASILRELISTHQNTNKAIVACSYENTFGPPVLFHKSLFEELLTIKGDVGARAIVREHTNAVELIPFPKGTYDVDTAEDYERIIDQ